MPLRCPKHLEFVRNMPCSMAGRRGHRCEGPIDPMHYRGSKTGGTSMKPGDNWVMPGCRALHSHQHQIGEKAFEAEYGISMREICKLTWALSPFKNQIEIGRPKRRKYKISSPGFSKTLRRKLNGKTVKRDAAARMA